MLDVAELFVEVSARPLPTARELWADPGKMKAWLGSVFDAILAAPSLETSRIDVPPYKFTHDGRNLFSVSLLALFNLRPRDAAISQQDVEYLFCDAFLDSIEFRGHETESFVSWAATMILRVAEEDEFLDFAPADFIRDHLLYMAVHDPLLTRLSMIERHSYVPLFVSGLFAIHTEGLWPQLFDRIDGRANKQMKLPFKLIEVFLNCFGEEELRFRSVTAEYVKETMKLLEYGVPHPDLAPEEVRVLQALRLAPEPLSRSVAQRIGETVRAVRRVWAPRKAGAAIPATKGNQHAHGVERLQLNDAA